MEGLTVAGNLEALGAIASYVQAAAASAGLSKARTYNLRLAVDEVITNIIIHGYQESGLTGDVSIHAWIDDAALTVCLEDAGADYNPYHIQDELNCEKVIHQPLEERPLGGLGVYLAMRSVDQFRYERIGDRNRTSFVVFRRSPS
jgi:anti-sigma regulatory factor (Ser/Thr protein kinase)